MEITNLTRAEMMFVMDAILEKIESTKYDYRKMSNDPVYTYKCRKQAEAIQNLLNKLPKEV